MKNYHLNMTINIWSGIMQGHQTKQMHCISCERNDNATTLKSMIKPS